MRAKRNRLVRSSTEALKAFFLPSSLQAREPGCLLFAVIEPEKPNEPLFARSAPRLEWMAFVPQHP